MPTVIEWVVFGFLVVGFLYAIYDAWNARSELRLSKLSMAERIIENNKLDGRIKALEKLTDDRAFRVEPLDPLMASLGLELAVASWEYGAESAQYFYDFEGNTWRTSDGEQASPEMQNVLIGAYDRYLTRVSLAGVQKPGELDIRMLAQK